MKRLAIFASSAGTNAEAIMSFFELHPELGSVVALISNRAEAFALTRADNHGVPSFYFAKDTFVNNPQAIIDTLESCAADFIVLAGFMILMPEIIIEKYRGRIVNIHPALLPKFGGKGMYGDNVHKAVIDAGEKKSGITIHFVDKRYDEGAIIFQAELEVAADDNPQSLAQKIHKLEHANFPRVIAEI